MLDEDKFSSNLLALAKKVQGAFKSIIGGKPTLEQEGRYLLVTVEEPDLDRVIDVIQDTLPAKWRTFTVASDEGDTYEYAPVQRVGAPFVSAYQGDNDETSIALFGTYTEGDLREGVLSVFNAYLMEKQSPSLRSKILELRGALGEGDATFQGKEGLWRTTKGGTHIFIPDKGEPMVGKNLTLKQAKAQSRNPAISSMGRKRGGSDGGVGGGDGAEPVTKSNWKDKLKAAFKKVGHALVHPIVAVKDLITKPEARKELKDHIVKSVKRETAETKQMLGTYGKALKGQKVSPEDRKQAIHQTVDLIKTAMTAAAVAHLFAGGALKAIATLTSPIDEVIAMGIDGPLRKATEKVFGQAHGLLPSAFYEGVESPDALMGKIIDAVLDELAKAEAEDL